MIIVDANVVLRYLLADIEYLYRNAKDIIENNLLAQKIIDNVLKNTDVWIGKATVLFELIIKDATNDEKKILPKAPNRLSQALTELAPALRYGGINIKHDRNANERSLIIERIKNEYNDEVPF